MPGGTSRTILLKLLKNQKKEEKSMRDSKIAEKQPVVQEIASLFDGAKGAVAVDYRGLTVAQDTELRKNLRKAGIAYKVYKNTMVRIAAKGTAFEGLDPYLEGPTAIAVSKEEETDPERKLNKFIKANKANEKLEMKGGVVEGTVYDAAGMAVVATIPGREELLARLFGSMKSPLSNLARVLNQIAEKDGAPAEAAAEAPAAE